MEPIRGPHQRRRKLKRIVRRLEVLRDDLRTRVDHFEADARVEFAELEPKLKHIERELVEAGDETMDAIARALGSLSTAFRRLQTKGSGKPRHA